MYGDPTHLMFLKFHIVVDLCNSKHMEDHNHIYYYFYRLPFNNIHLFNNEYGRVQHKCYNDLQLSKNFRNYHIYKLMIGLRHIIASNIGFSSYKNCKFLELYNLNNLIISHNICLKKN